jgi:hypothetical protein
MKKSEKKWTQYVFEFLTVFAGIMVAFLLNNWNENRKDSHAEEKILIEIKNGLRLDIADMQDNVAGHQKGVEACAYFRDLAQGKQVDDSLANQKFFQLLRDFISIQNKSGYESLKSRGLELVSNDSLRLAIISMYEFQFQALQKLEETYVENQFYQNYFDPLQRLLSPSMRFSEDGQLMAFEQPLQLTPDDQASLLLYLAKIEFNRQFIIQYYEMVNSQADKLIHLIDEELDE